MTDCCTIAVETVTNEIAIAAATSEIAIGNEYVDVNIQTIEQLASIDSAETTIVIQDATTIVGTIEQTFETVSKNIKAYPSVFGYVNGVLTTITYTLPVGTIIKTLGYANGVLTTVTLSGYTLDGISLTKTLSYTNGAITGISYS